MKKLHLWFIALLSLVSASSGHDLAKLERSFWLNASLAVPRLGYWGTSFAPPKAPTSAEISNAARMLIEQANPNRLYLIHHHELPVAETKRIFRDWRKGCPASVEIVPVLVLKMYDEATTSVFSANELDELLTFFKAEIHAERIAVYDVLPNRDQGEGLHTMEKQFSKGMIRVGLQPDEPLDAPFIGAVEDTWSGFCHGLTNADWQDRGFGRDTLRKWISLRNEQSKRIAYDLIVVAWDYANTKRGEYPGYDDAHKNLPLPAERNRLATREILALAKPDAFAGFSADLLIIELNSETPQHDGKESFYTTLKAGKPYNGFYATPWREVCEIFQALSAGKTP